MSSRYEEDGENRRAKRIVDETQEEVQAVRNRVWRQHLRGGVGLAGRRRLADVTIQYWDVLKKYREENRDLWDEHGLDSIRELAFREASMEQDSVGDTGATNTVRVPALVSLDVAQLLKLTDRLDDFAKALGFAASTKDVTPHDDGSLEDLAYLMKARGQDEALDRLNAEPPDDAPEPGEVP